jgi:hypothetical protein
MGDDRPSGRQMLRLGEGRAMIVSETALPQETRRTLMVEAAISIIPNAVVSALFVWLLFRGVQRIGLWGTQGVAFDLVPTTFMLTLMTTIGLTIIVRRRVQAGKAKPAAGSTRLPRNPVLRGIVLGLLMLLAFVPASVLALNLFWAGDWTFNQMLLFKIAYGIAIGLIATPLVVLAALRDR